MDTGREKGVCPPQGHQTLPCFQMGFDIRPGRLDKIRAMEVHQTVEGFNQPLGIVLGIDHHTGFLHPAYILIPGPYTGKGKSRIIQPSDFHG